jgi:hypothetical protein
MILMFMGRLIEARDELERAAEMFGMSEELIDWPPEPRARTPA